MRKIDGFHLFFKSIYLTNQPINSQMMPASNLSMTEMYFKHNVSVSTADGEHRMNHPTIPGAVLVVSVKTLYNIDTVQPTVQLENHSRPFPNIMPAATTAATTMAANVVGNNDPSINIMASSIMGMNVIATNAMTTNNKRVERNRLHTEKNRWGKRYLKDNHKDDAPLYIPIPDTDKVYCAKCFNNDIKIPILKNESLPSHVSICLPVSPFFKQPRRF